MILKTREYLKDKTSIIISHDFNIIKELATKYILINNNNINVGTHDELYNTVMIYKELYNSYSKSR
jgi:ABC-type multidrug transport system fused ATPase/permease subunit